jgi:hypothetical protein
MKKFLIGAAALLSMTLAQAAVQGSTNEPGRSFRDIATQTAQHLLQGQIDEAAAAAVDAFSEQQSVPGGTLSPMPTPAVVAEAPEPETYAMMIAGLAAVAFVARRRRR